MKRRKIAALTAIIGVLLVLGAGVGVVLAQGPHLGAAVGTAFTYQGQLMDDDSPADGTYDFEFKLHDHPTADSQVGSTLHVDDLDVADGLLTAKLDFGSGVFTGEARYLEIGVRAGDSSGAYTTLAPRQELTPTPYALHSLSTGSLQWYPVSETLPTTGQLLQWKGSAWEPATVASGNQAPVAILQANPAVIIPGQTTSLSLILSYDPEGGPLTYAFDPTGHTVGAPAPYTTTAVMAAQYTAVGDYVAAGWVKDASGALDVARALISVHGFWNTIADSAGSVGMHASLAIVDGHPAVAYYYGYGTGGALKYVRASDAAGSSWYTPVTVDSTGDVGRHASLTVINGNPAIAYYDLSNQDLKYVRASDATGSSWGTPVTVDSSGWVGEYASLAVVAGRPAIAYYDRSPNYDLKYVRASDATGSSWGTPVTVDSAGDVGMYASLAVVQNRPAIAYYDGNPNYDLKYVRAANASGSSWGTPVTVDSSGTVGAYASLAVVDGRPAIAYWGGGLKYVRANNAAGSSWSTPLTVDSSGDVGRCASLAMVDGRPAIAYYDYDPNYDLKYVQASDANGSSWPTPVVADGIGDVGEYASLAVAVDGRPAIAYYDQTNFDLRFAITRSE